ncbi:MAG: NUDIX domain-containing protein [Candidatus Nomurabacteria bacterium]|nr:NUDIX domain-containing protein [Candidatus Nomurabacteria bacterium]
MKLIQLINPENVSEEEVANYKVREASRAVVSDSEGKIALLHVNKENYYKLPGGGLEDGEDKMLALNRECLEEIGCKIEVLGEVGTTIENRKMFGLKQISYCFLAKVVGEKGKTDFTKKEIEKGFEVLWLPYNEALKVLKESMATSKEGMLYIVPRDTALLEESKSHF